MEINVKEFNPDYDFVVTGASYIGKPRPNTAMYVGKKVEYLVNNLHGVTSCLVFAENGVIVSGELLNQNCFVFTDSPQLEYALFVNRLAQLRLQQDKLRSYVFCDGGYYLGENVQIGENSYIEPGCLIGHDVVIGQNALIKAGTIIKNAVIGNDFVSNENAVIGAYGFTMTEDLSGNLMRIPTLGKVFIGNNVEVGVNCNVSCGSADDTIIEDHVKIDALVYIAHDVHIGKNARITAGVVVGGFVKMDEHIFMGFNSAIRNRISIGEGAIIGMGAVVTKAVEAGATVVGNPAKLL